MFSKPDLCHRNLFTGKRFFEGWYTRITTPMGKSYAFIFGFSKGDTPHGFIQVIDGVKDEYYYYPFDYHDFSSNRQEFSVHLEENNLTYHQLKLNLNEPEVLGTLKFQNISRWSTRKLCPGSMGVLAELPFLECYSQVCILNGTVEGKLCLLGEVIDFTGSQVYMEKNWGHSFPKWWCWCQSSLFEDRRSNFTLSMGKVPVASGYFTGLLACLTVDGQQYKFTTPNGALGRLNRNDNFCKGILLSREYKLIFKSTITQGICCKAPRLGNMNSHVMETLKSYLQVQLYNRQNGKLIYEGKSFCSGLELGGDWY